MSKWRPGVSGGVTFERGFPRQTCLLVPFWMSHRVSVYGEYRGAEAVGVVCDVLRRGGTGTLPWLGLWRILRAIERCVFEVEKVKANGSLKEPVGVF